MLNFKQVFLVAGAIMVYLVFFTPDIDYDSYFRFQVAYNTGFSLNYVQSLIWLPAYQYIIAFVGNFVLMRLFSVACVLFTAFVLLKLNAEKSVAVAASVLYVLNPFVILYGSLAVSESFATLLTILFVYLFSVKKHVAASMVLACGVLTSYSLWIFVPFALAYSLIKREKHLLVYVIPVLAIVSWGIVNLVFAEDPLHFVGLASTFYEAVSAKLSFEISIAHLFLFPLIYPLSFIFPFFVQFVKGNLNWKSSPVKVMLVYFIISTTLLLFVGQATQYIFGWGRYFIPLIPIYIILGTAPLLKSKHKRLWIIIYFLVAAIATVIEAYYVYDLKLRMSAR